MTGIVGAAGGIGGFLLPSLLGYVKGLTGSFGIGFALLSVIAVSGAASLWYLKSVWRRTWPEQAALRAGLVSETELNAESYAASA
jgi:NNP family nitrate/nitrite transporter-like MFS transporter